MYIDDSKLNSYSREELEKAKMVIDIAKVIHDMQMDKERFATERMKMQAEIDEVIKKTKHHPSSAIIVASIACFGSIVVALIAAVTFWLRNPV